MLEDLLTFGNSGLALSGSLVFTNLMLSFVLSLIVAIVYKMTHKGLSYSQSFVMTLIISAVVITAVMMVIGSNIAIAFGIFCAFSLLRFRTAIKDAKDMGYMFLVLAIGMAIGTHNYLIAFYTTAIVLGVIIVLTKMNFGSIRRFDYILTLNLDTNQTSENIYKPVFGKYLKSSNILNIKAVEAGKVLQLSFSIKFISEQELEEFIRSLEKLDGVSQVNLITAKNDVEY